jgi:hypothetical protein
VQRIPAASADLSMDPPCSLAVRVTLRLSETVCVALCPATGMTLSMMLLASR